MVGCDGVITMVKLRFANLNAELDGDAKEIVSILRDLGVSNQTTKPITPPSEVISPDETTTSNDELFQKLPDRPEIVKMIEGLGKPFSFNLMEQQKNILGRVVNSRENRPLYSKFYDLHKYARNEIKKKYGGRWISSDEVVDGHQTTRYTWAADEEIKLPTIEPKTQSLEQFEVKQD